MDLGLQIICRAIAAIGNGYTFAEKAEEVYKNSHSLVVETQFKELNKKATPVQRKNGAIRKWRDQEYSRVETIFANFNTSADALLDLYSDMMSKQPVEQRQESARIFRALNDFITKYEFQYDEVRPGDYVGLSGRDCLYVIGQYQLNFNMGNAFKCIVKASKSTLAVASGELRKAVQYLKFQLDPEFELICVNSTQLSDFDDESKVCKDFQIPAELVNAVNSLLSLGFNSVPDQPALVNEAIKDVEEYIAGIEVLLTRELSADTNVKQEEGL